MSDKKHDLQTVLDAVNGEGYWQPREDGKFTHSFGNISTIARRLGVSRTTVYKYIKDWASVKAAIDDGREELKDFVQSKMLQRIVEGSDTMIIFYAKTQMKDRGFVERQEINHSGEIGSKLVILPNKE